MTTRGGVVRAIHLLGLMAATVTLVHAHPISVSRASVYLTRQRATVRIEVFLEDLYLFHQLKPNGAGFLETTVIERGIKLHQEFLRERFKITDVEGIRYEPKSVEAVSVELPSEGVPLADLMAHQLEYELQYEFTKSPDILTFTQQFTDEKDVLPSEMNLQVKQENAGAAVEQTLLPLEPYSLRIDWDNPPLSPEASDREQARWAARQKETLLGITSDSSVYSFLYVEDFEVRHEILAPAKTLGDAISLGADDVVLDVAQQDSVADEIAAYFASGNPIVIDGHPREPVAERCEFYGLDRKDFAQPSQRRPVPLSNARVGVILTYRLGQRPQSLQMTWDRFNENLWGVTTVVIAGEDITRKKLTRVGSRNVLQWERRATDVPPASPKPVPAEHVDSAPMPLPWLSGLLGLACLVVSVCAVARPHFGVALLALALLIGAGAAWSVPRSRAPVVSDDEAMRVFRQVHANMYQSFARRTEDSIYDTLALSVDGDLLQKIYLEVRRGLAMEDQGGAAARIREVDLVETSRISDSIDEPASIRMRCRWNVSGTVEHWGHRHQRTNQYDAEFVLAPTQGWWKLVDMELLDEQRVSSETTLQSL